MRKSILVAILFSISFCAINAQDNTYSSLISQAEVAILEVDYQSALTLYKSGFNKFDKPFAKDIDNALLCAVEVGDFESCNSFVKRLISLGCDLNYFFKRKSLETYRESIEWWDFLKEYPTLRSDYMANRNHALRAKVESWLGTDQYWRVKDPSYNIHEDVTFKEDDIIIKEWQELTKENTLSEYEIGVFIENDTLIVESPIWYVLLHNYTSSEAYRVGVDVTPRLGKLVKQNAFSADVFAYLSDRSGAYRIEKGFGREALIWSFNGAYYKEKRSNEETLAINTLRKKYELDSLSLARKKALFELTKDGRFHFFQGILVTSAGLPQGMIDKFYELIE